MPPKPPRRTIRRSRKLKSNLWSPTAPRKVRNSPKHKKAGSSLSREIASFFHSDSEIRVTPIYQNILHPAVQHTADSSQNIQVQLRYIASIPAIHYLKSASDGLCQRSPGDISLLHKLAKPKLHFAVILYSHKCFHNYSPIKYYNESNRLTIHTTSVTMVIVFTLEELL